MNPPSIVVPVHNKAALTAQCLDALLGRPETAGAEIIVVDDASTDSTPQMLGGYSSRVAVIRNDANLGFAGACNRGVQRAGSELVILLNNDVRPAPGWTAALTGYAREHPAAAVVGAKLMFPNDTVQHAGLVFARDGNPYHLYAGFPADHPAVNRSRPFQAVTAACILLRRSIFLQEGGFDRAFHNGHEDVDLCLRLGDKGHEIHYCHTAEGYHLESASRDVNSPSARDNGRLYRRRWAGRVVPDDFEHYLADGLISAGYSGGYPLELQVSPMLGVFEATGGAAQLERLLKERSIQVGELLAETARLALLLTEMHPGAKDADVLRRASPSGGKAPDAALSPEARKINHGENAELDHRLEDALCQLQRAMAARLTGFEPSPWLGYRCMVRNLRGLIRRVTPEGSTVAVVSRGDSQLLDVPARRGEHLPQDPEGGYSGFHPGSDAEAIEALEKVRMKGAGYLAVPATACWWLDHYPDFAAHLHRIGRPLDGHPEVGLVFSLQGGSGSPAVLAGRREGSA